jgi:hypothetical protein
VALFLDVSDNCIFNFVSCMIASKNDFHIHISFRY